MLDTMLEKIAEIIGTLIVALSFIMACVITFMAIVVLPIGGFIALCLGAN